MFLFHPAVEDLFWYAQTMYYTGQYHRAIHLLNSRKLIKVGCNLWPNSNYLSFIFVILTFKTKLE